MYGISMLKTGDIDQRVEIFSFIMKKFWDLVNKAVCILEIC